MINQPANQPTLLAHHQAGALLQARAAGRDRIEVSLNLGLTRTEVHLRPAGVLLPDGQSLAWSAVEEIRDSERGCFEIVGGVPEKIQLFSEATNLLYSLMPTEGAPTMLISGTPMHRFKDIDPHRDTLTKIQTIAPIRGRVLDTATGLGYTAIEAARTADHVTTVEIAPEAIEIARHNPWSRELFDHPRITQVIGDVVDEIKGFADEAFSRIIHDPPMFSLAGDLYSGAFYGQLYRILRRGGRLFHYIGDPQSKSGHTVTRGVIRRLKEAGFTGVMRQPEAFGLVAHK